MHQAEMKSYGDPAPIGIWSQAHREEAGDKTEGRGSLSARRQEWPATGRARGSSSGATGGEQPGHGLPALGHWFWRAVLWQKQRQEKRLPRLRVTLTALQRDRDIAPHPHTLPPPRPIAAIRQAT